MKKIITIISFLLLVISYSCEDALKEEVYGKISDEKFWQTEKDAVAAIKSAYSETRGGWQGLSLWQFVVEDLGTDIGTGGYFSTYNYSNYTGWSGTNPDFTAWGIWPPFWQSINYANTVLYKVPEMDIDEDVKNRILGEAHAIRALMYFHLVNWFGEVPVVSRVDKIVFEIPQQSVDSIYRFIESDLLTAIDLLPLKSDLIKMGEQDYGRVSKQAAQALLVKTYLQTGNYIESEKIAGEILSSGEYALEQDYLNIFSLSNEGYANSEVVWVMPFIAGTSPVVDGLVLQVYMYRAAHITDYNEYFDWSGDLRATTSFYETFDKNDKRRKGLALANDGTTDPVMLIKYPADPATDGRYSGNDYPFIRLADVILMRAEALAQLDNLDGAVNEINKVRNRAGLSDINATDFTKETLLAHILKERRWELYFEGHVKQDMIRLDKEGMLNHIKSVSEDWETYGAERYLILPKPSNALASNPALDQNNGF